MTGLKRLVTCEECKGDCCRKLAVHISEPKIKEDFDDLKWYLYHEGVYVYIDNEDDWLVLLPVKCKWLDGNNKCKIYNRRPPVCRKAAVEECERNIQETKLLFRTEKDVDDYMKKHDIN